MFLQFGAGKIFADGLMRGRLAGEDEIAAGLLDGGGDRLAGEQVVAEEDWPAVRHERAVPGQPALCGVALAILLLRPVLGGDEFRRQRQDLLMAGGDDAGAEEGMEILGPAVRAPPGRAARAMDFARTEMLGPVEGDQHAAAEALERGEHALDRDSFVEHWIECGRRSAVQHQADIGVGRDGGHVEQGLAVRPAAALLQRALVREERGAAHEEQRKRGHADVGHPIDVVSRRPLAPVWKTSADLAKLLD